MPPLPVAPLVSVIIPTWNGAHHLGPCLSALRAQSYQRFEIIVVDNGSHDGTLELLATRWPEVPVVALPSNHGFAGGVNAGLAVARGAVIALVNNDTAAEPEWLEQLVAALVREPGAAMAASKIKLWNDHGRLHAAGDFYTVGGRPGNRGVWEPDDGRFDEATWVFAPNAGAAAYRREVFDVVGGFDERFGSYCEDVDLGWRAQVAGFHCLYVPKAVIYHRVSATGGGVLASYYTGRNWLYVLAKNYPGSLLRRYWPAIVREQVRVTLDALRAWRGAAARARLRGQVVGLCTLPRLLLARREVLRHPEVSDDYLEQILLFN
ncbi:MAG: glycosyltransferase family 2 protein [Ardenticatenaceae bacterium]|nr:glycosyltransferase family 2 protein [Ardenticatenaceae bacterium]